MRTLTQKLEIIEEDMLLVGIDLGHDDNVVHVMDRKARRLSRFRFGHSHQEYQKFIEKIKGLMEQHGKTSVLVGMEPTNHYWQLVAKALERAGIRYRLVNAYTVSKYREGAQIDLSKDDDRDSFFVTDSLRIGNYMESQCLSATYAEMRHLSTLYEQHRSSLARIRTQLKQIVRQLFPEFEEEFKDLWGLTGQAVLQRYASPSEIRRLSVAEFVAEVRKDFKGKKLAVKKLYRLYELAQESIGIPEWQGLQMSISHYLAQARMWIEQKEEARRGLLSRFHTLPLAPWAISLGLGPLNTALVIAEIGDISQFKTGSSLVKLAGLQPVPNSSGRYTRSKTPISKKGRPRLRTALYFGALNILQEQPVLKEYYERLKSREKNRLLPMQALCALMAKTLRIMHSLVRQATSFDPEIWKEAAGMK